MMNGARRIADNLLFLLITAVVILASSSPSHAIPKSKTPPISPAWVFDHWVWEDDDNTADAIINIVNEYKLHDIPVGAVIIDSPWATEYNNFIWNTESYPDPQGFINMMHSRGIKVVLWMTPMLNKESDGGNFEPKTNQVYIEALQKGYLANDGGLTKWWKGNGAFLDYTNPEAVTWWHGLLDRVLLMGIDGWKCDGTDPLFPSDGGFGLGGALGPRKYKNLYYMDTYEHTLARNPLGITMTRAIDKKFLIPDGYSPISHSPVNWMGDQNHDWGNEGFLLALQNMFDSAKLGYNVLGTDTAGYHGDKPITKNLLIRWAQFSALCPFFENGGHGNRKPWLFDSETTQIYRKFVFLHQELKPYLYSMMMNAHQGGDTIMRVQHGEWQYKLGSELFVSVIYEDKNDRDVSFPKGKWLDYWDNKTSFDGGQTAKYTAALDRYPLFIRDGAIIPMYVSDPVLGHGDYSFKDAVTLDIYPNGKQRFDLYEEGRDPVAIDVVSTPQDISVTASSGERPFLIRMLCPKKPMAVESSGRSLQSFGTMDNLGGKDFAYYYDADNGRLWINPGKADTMDVRVTLEPPLSAPAQKLLGNLRWWWKDKK